MIKRLAYFIMITLCIGCKDDDTVDCSVVTCLIAHIKVNLIDDSTKENIILKNSLTEENIIIQDITENQMEFSIIESNGILFIPKSNKSGNFKILIDSEIVSNIYYNTSAPKTNECCDSGDLTDVLVENKVFIVEDHLITINL